MRGLPTNLTLQHRLFIKLLVAAALLGGAATAGAATTGVFGGSTTSSGAGGGPSAAAFAVLNDAPTPMPLTQVLRTNGTNAATDGHLAFDNGRFRFFAVTPSGSRDLLCLTVQDGSTVVNSCRLRSALRPTDLLWITHALPDDRYELYTLAPNGITRISVGGATATVTHNAALLQNLPDSAKTAIVETPHGNTTVGIGAPSIPPGVVVDPNP